MAVKDVISRGIGPSTSLLYFVTGGYAIGDSSLTWTVQSDVSTTWSDQPNESDTWSVQPSLEDG